MVRQTAAIGLLLVGLVAIGFRPVFGPTGATAGAMFGGLAVGLQLVAAAVVTPTLRAGDYRGLMRRWAMGLGVRLLGIVALPVAVWYDRVTFPPLPAALGFIAVMVPLLFFEIRRFR